MIRSFTITNYVGDTITIDMQKPEKSGFLVYSVTGLGPVAATINTSEVATNDGSLFNSARLSQRNIVFQFVFVDNVLGEKAEDLRQKSYKYFPTKKNITIAIKTDNRQVQISGYVESNEPSIFSSAVSTQISVICPDPYFYSTAETEDTVTSFYTLEPIFEFPFCNDSLTEKQIVFGHAYSQTENVVTYRGDLEVGMVIRIHAVGSASNIHIYNIQTREEMSIDTTKMETLTGSGLVQSDDIIINTCKGSKSVTLVREGTSYNILNCLDKNTDWLSLSKGDNLFAFTADDGITNLQFRIEHKIVYEGV